MALPVQSKTRRSLALLFTVPLAFSLMFFIANTNAENTDIEILTVQNLRSTLHTMFALAQDAETSERGFLLTGDERYLLPYEQAQSQIKTQIELCRVLFKDRPEMKHDVDLFTNLVQNKFQQVQKTLQAQQKGGFSAALEYVKSGAGQDTMDEIRPDQRRPAIEVERRTDCRSRSPAFAEPPPLSIFPGGHRGHDYCPDCAL